MGNQFKKQPEAENDSSCDAESVSLGRIDPMHEGWEKYDLLQADCHMRINRDYW